MKTKDSRENAAANAVADSLTEVLGTAMQPRKWDDGSASAMHDFYIEGGVHRIALEVTTLADGVRVGRDVRWERLAPAGRVQVEGLRGCWTAYHEGDAEARDVIVTLRAHLPHLEFLGLPDVDTRTWQQHAFTADTLRPPSFAAARALHLVGVMRVSRVVDASQELLEEHGGDVLILRECASLKWPHLEA